MREDPETEGIRRGKVAATTKNYDGATSTDHRNTDSIDRCWSVEKGRYKYLPDGLFP